MHAFPGLVWKCVHLQDLIILPDHRTSIRNKIHQILQRFKQLPLTVILPPRTYYKGNAHLGQLPDHRHIFRIDGHGSIFYQSSVYVGCD